MRKVMLGRTVAAVALAAALGGAKAGQAAAPQGPDLYLDWDGVKVRFIDRGQGEAVVLVHGITMNADSNWGIPWAGKDQPSMLEALAKKYRVIAIDARGHGKSDKPHDCYLYGARMAEDVVRVMDALRVRKAHLIGFSMGGTIASALMVQHPERFRSVVLLAPKLERDEELIDGRDPGMDEIARGLERGDGIKPLMKALTPPGSTPPSDEQIEAQSNAVLAGQDPEALACAARGLNSLSVSGKDLAQVKLPVLALVGTQDPLQQGTQALARQVRGTQLHPVEGATHLSLLGAPRLIPDVKAFLAAHPIR